MRLWPMPLAMTLRDNNRLPINSSGGDIAAIHLDNYLSGTSMILVTHRANDCLDLLSRKMLSTGKAKTQRSQHYRVVTTMWGAVYMHICNHVTSATLIIMTVYIRDIFCAWQSQIASCIMSDIVCCALL